MDSIQEFLEDEDPMPEGVENLFLGAFLGGAIGDALGSFCEGWPRERILEVKDLTAWYRDRKPRKALPNPHWSMKGGAYTDDTQQTLVLAESVLACGGADAADLADRFLKMWRDNELYGYGRAFKQTMDRLDSGTPWTEAASTDMPSNGAVMKIAPIGLWHWQQGEEIREDAIALSQVTHRDPRAVAAAVSIAHVVGHLVTHRPLDTNEVLDVAEWSARPIHEPTGELIGQVRRLLQLPEDEAYDEMLSLPESAFTRGQGFPGEAPISAVVALEAFLRTPREFEETIYRSLVAGGDVDTFAAIAGTMSGVYNGVGGLPDHLLEDLTDESEIRELAKAFYLETVR